MTSDRIPRMHDPNGHIRDSIAALEPRGTVDDTPAGRLVALDRDTWMTYREMYRLLTVPHRTAGDFEDMVLRGTGLTLDGAAPALWVAMVHDQAGLLVDLHARTTEAYGAEFARRWGW